ncbi:MAG: Hsp20/alpha crystallin family protein [Patescibacteria group bacterium]
MAKKPSFFDRLTGASYDNEFETYETPQMPAATHPQPMIDEPQEAQLTVDVYQDNDNIYIRALVAGVSPSDLDISISRDMVTIHGKRIEERSVDETDYVYQELYWGAFARSVVLPAEVDVDAAEAEQKHGLLTIKLPKMNKDRKTKLKVRG